MSLTGNHIATALKAAGSATTGKVASLDEIADLFNDAMTNYGGGEFTTLNRVAALVSECMMESAYFMTTVEYANTGAYQPYRGRTFIQLTWSANYDKFGTWCHQQGLLSDPDRFVNHPVDLGHLEWAALGGVWYFTRVQFHGKALVEYAGNIEQVGKAVNLGDPNSSYTPNGMAARRAAYNAVVKLGKTIIPPATSSGSTGSSDVGTTTVTTPVHPTEGEIHTPYGQKGTSWQKGYHPGDDWHRNAGAAEVGDPIVAVADGTILYAGDARQTDAGWGKDFGIHVLNQWAEHGRTSIDAHMSKVTAKAGQKVKAGDKIGEKGATGNVTGPHDHHEQHTGPKWTDPDVKPIYPGTTTTTTVAPTSTDQEDFDVSTQSAPQVRSKAQTVKPDGKYHQLKLEDNDDVSFGFGGGRHQVNARFTITGATAAEELMVRVMRLDTDSAGKTIANSEVDYWVQGLGGGDGKSYRLFSWQWHVPAPAKGHTRRLRLEAANFTKHDIGVAAIHTVAWKAPL